MPERPSVADMVRPISVPTHVGLNLIYLVPGETGGMETYARELIPALSRERPGLRITAFVNAEAYEESGPWTAHAVEVPVRARRRSEWVRGEQVLLPRVAARAGVDLLHSLGSTAPTWGRFRRVVTIQDVIYRIYPEAHSGMRARVMGILVPLAARRSDRVLVPSTSTRDDLVRLLGVPAGKIDVAPLGVGSAREEPTPEPVLRAAYGLGSRRVVLTASAKRPHKNLLRLLDAWALIPADERPVLLLPGYPTEHEDRLREHASRLGLGGDTRFPGWVSPAELEGLYGLASSFVFPSLYEGFGLPVLEAMSRGLPVACSGRASLAEVAGDAALKFDPENPGAIASAVMDILRNQSLAQSLRRAGIERARQFTWEATARATLASYERALAAPT
jgi:glycosyltransferase involved in cell wall biosynthesis